ncbi:MAG: YciI family protein [Candidatus Dormibacteraeota bacterium]|nr:YciI family protein [Candidatus Dormibacteraeota bacterium]
MKYMLLLTRGEWEDSAPAEEQQRIYAEIGEWWAKLASEGKMVGGHQLQPPHTATTLVLNARREATVVDGPFMEAKESVGGYGILEAADLDEAMAIARTFPSPSSKVEVRPVLER